jgi:integrase
VSEIGHYVELGEKGEKVQIRELPRGDLTRGIWTQPSARTKKRKVHIVPLSKPVVRILEALRQHQAELKNLAKRNSRFVFHNPRNPDLAVTCLQKVGERVRVRLLCQLVRSTAGWTEDL